MTHLKAILCMLGWILGVYLLTLWAALSGCSFVYYPPHQPGTAQIEADKVVQPLCFMDCNSGTHNLKADDNKGTLTAGDSSYSKASEAKK